MKHILAIICLSLFLLTACSGKVDPNGKQCSEDSSGVVRVLEGDSKHVYRNECYEGILIDYGCEKGDLVSHNIRCEKGCTLDKYRVAQCIE